MTRPAKPDRQKRLAVILLWGCITASAFCADSPSIAPTPPMGWNSWDSYGTTVGEAQVKANANVMGSGLGITASSAEVRDLWLRKPLGSLPGIKGELRPHASVLYRVANLQIRSKARG